MRLSRPSESLSDRHFAGVPPCGTIRGDTGDDFSLGVTTFIGCANLNDVLA